MSDECKHLNARQHEGNFVHEMTCPRCGPVLAIDVLNNWMEENERLQAKMEAGIQRMTPAASDSLDWLRAAIADAAGEYEGDVVINIIREAAREKGVDL